MSGDLTKLTDTALMNMYVRSREECDTLDLLIENIRQEQNRRVDAEIRKNQPALDGEPFKTTEGWFVLTDDGESGPWMTREIAQQIAEGDTQRANFMENAARKGGTKS